MANDDNLSREFDKAVKAEMERLNALTLGTLCYPRLSRNNVTWSKGETSLKIDE